MLLLTPGNCWRCYTENVDIVHDPLMPANDKIGVCAKCARERLSIRRRHPDHWWRLDIV